MKKIIIATIALLTVFSGYAQDPLWRKSTMTTGNITFNVETSLTVNVKGVDRYIFSVSNTTNTRDSSGTLYYKNGEEVMDMGVYESSGGNPASGSFEQAIAATFTDAQIANLAKSDKNPMIISYVVSPEGKTLEVSFSMSNTPEMLSITPAQFAALDSNLKKYVTWTVNDVGKQLQYVHTMQFVWFGKLNIVRTTPPATGSGSSSSSSSDGPGGTQGGHPTLNNKHDSSKQVSLP